MEFDLVYRYLPCFYQNIHLKEMRQLFTDIMASRVTSYSKRYPENLYALSAEDFISDHIAIVDVHSEEILGSFKFIKLKTCTDHNTTFPLLATLKTQNSKRFDKFMTNYIKTVDNSNGHEIAYIGALNIEPNLKATPRKKDYVKLMLAAAIVNCSTQNDIKNIFVTGTIPNSSYKFIEWLGFKVILDMPVNVESVGRTPAFIMEWREWSHEALLNAQRFKEMWEFKDLKPVSPEEKENVKVNQAA